MSELIKNGYLSIDTQSEKTKFGGRELNLSYPEYKILAALNRGNEILSLDQLIEIVWNGTKRPKALDKGIHQYILSLRKKVSPDYIFSYMSPTGYRASNSIERRMISTGKLPRFNFS
jgi:DNA-binding response OmpR family regulator